MPRPTPFLTAVLAIVRKDLRAELRSRQLISAIGLFALLATMTFYFALENHPEVRLAVLPGVLWVIVVFASTLGLTRSLAQEFDQGNLDGLLLAPIDRSALFYGKFITAWLFAVLVGLIVSVAFIFIFNMNLSVAAWWLIIVLGTAGIASIGTLVGSMAVQGRARETTLPILVLPVALPIITAAVNACSAILNGLTAADWSPWAVLLAAADVVFILLPLILFDFIVEE